MKTIRKLLAILGILLLVYGLYVAVKGFSGYDPLAFSQKELFAVLTSRGKQVLNSHGLGQDSNITHTPIPKPQLVLKVGLVADSHTDNGHLAKALAELKNQKVTAVIGLGDYTNVGTMQELNDTKQVFDQAQIPYYVVPGDHDFWDNKNKGETATKNFEAVFGKDYQTITLNQIPLILLDNADNDAGLNPGEFDWLKSQLAQEQSQKQSCQTRDDVLNANTCNWPVLVFLHTPLYNPTTDHIMGRLNPKVDSQRKDLLTLFHDTNVNEIIAGDLHFFSRYTEPVLNLEMTTIGAITEDRNLQTPRYAILAIYSDGSYMIDDKEIGK